MKTHLWVFVVLVLAGAAQGAEAAHVVVADDVSNSVNIRAEATVNSAIIGKLFPGDALVLTDERPRWFVVQLFNGQTGYVSRRWTRKIQLATSFPNDTETVAAQPSSEPDVTRSAQVEIAKTVESNVNSVEGYRLKINDRVRVVVFGHEDLSGEFAVDGSGRLSLPLIQFVEAHDLTTEELERAITDQLRPDYLKNPRVSVEILSLQPVYVIGEVREPGSYPYTSGMTVLNAVALAGGYTYRAARKKLTVMHADDPDRKQERVRENSAVQPGDVIEIPERLF
ncbi:MAG: polysaccharide biosynthesis/export family protein [Gammaproteobacteria bacterium]|nr:polysaccharide biosynthesis/export family protein [Gammaproteobacteria bacterium]MDH3768021.1 polysaccharide biosynthesis/export family protein [Gammaproteobacteria bacterium]